MAQRSNNTETVQPEPYMVLLAIDWVGGKHAEPGEIRDDLYIGSLGWLFENSLIRELTDEERAGWEAARKGGK
jgi:hypothetical protein